MLLMPDEIVNQYETVPFFLTLNNHVLVLAGGLVEQAQEMAAFAVDWRRNMIVELGSEKKTVEPLYPFIRISEHQVTQSGSLKYAQYTLGGLGTLQQLSHEDDSKQQNETFDLPLWGAHLPQEEDLVSLENVVESTHSTLKVLFYRDIGRVERAADDIADIPLQADILSTTEIHLPEDIENDYPCVRKSVLPRHSITLLRLLQVIKHFRATHLKNAPGQGDPFEDPTIQDLSEMIDNFNKLPTDAKESSIKDMVLSGIKFMADLKALFRYEDLVISGGKQIRNLFPYLYGEQDVFHKLGSSFNFNDYKFDASVYNQIIIYETFNGHVPLILKLKVDDDHECASFRLFAFMDFAELVYTFDLVGDYMVVHIYGTKGGRETRILDLRRDKHGKPTLHLRGSALAFYAYRPPKMVKGIISEVPK